MNFIFSSYRKGRLEAQRRMVVAALFVASVIIGASPFAPRVRAQNGGDPAAGFKRISEELSAARLAGEQENEAQMGKALAYLDSVAMSVLNVTAGPNLDGANRTLAGLVSHSPPVGENYRLVKLGGNPPAYAMAINFGLGGPAAVRIYSGSPGHYALAARIDHFVQKDFFDSDLELAPVSDTEPVFVTVSGRTDDLSTGLFSAWKFDGHGVVALWNSDLLQQSSYEASENVFRLAYCSQVDEDHPSECFRMSRDVYRYQSGEWMRIQTEDLPPSRPSVN